MLDEVKAFLENKGILHYELTDRDWQCKFCYLVDITGHLNQLNMRMQGHGTVFYSLYQAVLVSETKLELFTHDIESGRLLHSGKTASQMSLLVMSTQSAGLFHI